MDLSIEGIILFLAQQFPVVLSVVSILGSLVVAGQVVVQLTPSQKDDAAWEKLKAIPIAGMFIAALSKFAVIQKK